MERLGEREVRNEVAEVRMHEITTAFFRPKYESANHPYTPDPASSTGMFQFPSSISFSFLQNKFYFIYDKKHFKIYKVSSLKKILID